jgi:hypothetical protein
LRFSQHVCYLCRVHKIFALLFAHRVQEYLIEVMEEVEEVEPEVEEVEEEVIFVCLYVGYVGYCSVGALEALGALAVHSPDGSRSPLVTSRQTTVVIKRQ